MAAEPPSTEIDTLRYNGEALNDFRNQRSTCGTDTGREVVTGLPCPSAGVKLVIVAPQ